MHSGVDQAHAPAVAPHEQDGCADPGRDLGKVYAPFPEKKGEDQGTGDAADEFHAAGQHGDEGVADALEGGAEDEEQVQEGQTGGHDNQETVAVDSVRP